ncbi:hypothetical protein [Rhizobium sp. MHM7A]|uniref:hypothetical protein n=1 Tax=Rhizobium sp. MHM7A TaxID=2583233 RepID=UPI001106D86A|nr:hypothetical protein [Rhizobium sp. MHM7A]TLX16833.1 hypothetical protein FFR93_05665 [Rhizobium sp. MHM7A]
MALDAAVRALTPFEEPGRHFGSPLFMSLVCVLTDQADKACWDVINEYLQAEKQREDAGIPVEHIQVHEIKVKIGKAGSFLLPDDVVENRAVHLVIATLRDTEESHLRMMTPRQLKSMVDDSLHDAELNAAIEILERDDVEILKQVWIYTDPNSGEEHCLTDKDRKVVLETGIFVHPDEGVIVDNFRADLSVYYALNTDNQEFMEWKADFEPAAMKF